MKNLIKCIANLFKTEKIKPNKFTQDLNDAYRNHYKDEHVEIMDNIKNDCRDVIDEFNKEIAIPFFNSDIFKYIDKYNGDSFPCIYKDIHYSVIRKAISVFLKTENSIDSFAIINFHEDYITIYDPKDDKVFNYKYLFKNDKDALFLINLTNELSKVLEEQETIKEMFCKTLIKGFER